ncbi:hypothetical protein Barb7_01661 [Bacteroidales bacterium Barb7]|nr:hypothetical protein Barb7_01661 [Bacteroidales bacterium Barb7]
MIESRVSVFRQVRPICREIGAERKLEKGMSRHTGGIDGCHTGRRNNHHALGAESLQVSEKGSLPRSRLSGQENVVSGVADIIQCKVSLLHPFNPYFFP